MSVSVPLSCTPSVSVIILYPKCQCHYPVPQVSVSLSCTPSVSVIILYPKCQCHYPVPQVSVSLSCTPSVSTIILYPSVSVIILYPKCPLSCTPSVSAIILYPKCQCHYPVPQVSVSLSCTPSVSAIILYPKCQCHYPVPQVSASLSCTPSVSHLSCTPSVSVIILYPSVSVIILYPNVIILYPKCQCHYPVPQVSVSLSCTPSVSVIILYPKCQCHYPVPQVSVSLSCTPSVSVIILYPKCQCHYPVPQVSVSLSCTPSVSVIILYPKCNFLSFGKMGQKRDLTGSEKSTIVRCLAEGCSSLEIAKLLKRDHRTIKHFMANSQQVRKKHVNQKRCKITAHELRKIKREAAKMPFATSVAIFQNCNVTGVSKSTRCAILRDMAKVLWTNEMRVTLDGPDGWARGWISKGQRASLRLRHQQGGGGGLVGAGIIKDELVGSFRVEDGVKLNSQTYCPFLEDNFFKQWYRKKSVSFKKNMIFMQDNAPSHASNYSTVWLASKGLKEEKIMTWPPCSPDLNLIENLWSLRKCEIYREGKQSTSRNSVWEAVVAAARNVDRKQIKQLTESMDGRLLSVIIKKGNQGKYRVTKRGPALSNPMFTLVTRGLRHRWSLESCLCDSSPATSQRLNSDAAAIGIVVYIAAASLNVTVPLESIGQICSFKDIGQSSNGFGGNLTHPLNV
ncbi:unnamed protein product [Ranitomeya imitator]|uniref:Tc1-like transposase DDE domain-containing protein n=1 Tax=Ranitomeya imitator TaxID=111125 RepID=A0ABN9L133_9NEOB|nr:unnamed protein product [Ranitomeya imitator]